MSWWTRTLIRSAITAVLIGLLSLGFWAPAWSQQPKTLVIAIDADPAGLDPQQGQSADTDYVVSTIFDGIVDSQPGSSLVGPGLAQKWTISPDGKTYTFALRHGVTFHDGTPMNAHTVADDLDRAINPNNPCYVLGRKGVSTYDDFTFGSTKAGNVVAMKVVDDYTLQFTLPQPNAPFLTNLAMVQTGIMSPTATKQYNCDAGGHPSGTGPFKFVEHVADDHVTLEANAGYWRGRPKVDRIIFQIIPESTTRLLKLRQNEVQILSDVPPSDYDQITSNRDLRLYKQPGLTILAVVMSNDAPPFNDKRVRQALNYAVDKDAINKGLYGGATTASQGMPPVLWGYDKAVQPYPYDPDKAKALLKEAGFPNGFSTDMMVYSIPRSYNPIGGAKLGEAVQAYLTKVGVNVKVTQYEWGAYLNKLRFSPWTGLGIWGWIGDSGDPDNFLGAMFAWDSSANKPVTNNVAHYYNPQVNTLIQQGRTSTDQAKRAQAYIQANRLIHDDAPWLFINHMNQARAARASVKGLLLNPVQMYFYMERVSLQ